jgi:hypothetical protein
VGAYDHWEFRATGITAQVGFGVITVDERLLVRPFVSPVCIAIFVVNDNEEAIRESEVKL